jgi:spore maturation protein SpmB
MRNFTRAELVSKKGLCIDCRGARVTVGKSKTLSAAAAAAVVIDVEPRGRLDTKGALVVAPVALFTDWTLNGGGH